ncbi:MAG: hypothetical protein KAS21_01260 [Candidatus Aminicenantes bacterium]|nr:hypothetical protein [Candidatus Aminicenantes bacterium]
MRFESINSELEKWKPGVPKNILLLIAGLFWIGVGIFLNSLSYSWLKREKTVIMILLVFFGLFLAIIIHYFGFSRIVNKNLQRIIPMDGKKCIFSFIPWRSYVIISIMILMGSFIRHSTIIPKVYLSVLYTGIGSAMILSGFRYIIVLKRVIQRSKRDKY